MIIGLLVHGEVLNVHRAAYVDHFRFRITNKTTLASQFTTRAELFETPRMIVAWENTLLSATIGEHRQSWTSVRDQGKRVGL